MFTDTKQPASEPAPIRKFMFERSFDDATVVHRAPERKPVLMKPEQLDELKQEGYNAGFEAGKAAGLDEQTAQLTAIVATVEKNIDILMQCMDALNQEQNTHTRQLVLSVVRKMMPDLMARNGMQEIEALLSDTLRTMSREPRLVIRVNDAQLTALSERIDAMTSQRAYSGKVIVLSDADVVSGDCRIEWADGGIERNSQETMSAIEQTLLPSS